MVAFDRLASDASVGGRRMNIGVVDANVCIVNAIRRAVFADVKTLAVPFDSKRPADASAIVVHKNTSRLDSEGIKSRIALVPICASKAEMDHWGPGLGDYTFELNVKVPENATMPLHVTTRDVVVRDRRTGTQQPNAMRDRLFPVDPLSGHPILLLTMFPGSGGGGAGEEVRVSFNARLGSGMEHARWMPASECFFNNRRDPERYQAALDKVVRENAATEPEAIARVTSRFDSLDAKRQFMTDEHGRPNAFDFTIYSECGLSPAEIFEAAIDVLIDKVMRLKADIDAAVVAQAAGSIEPMRVRITVQEGGAVRMEIDGENDTLGSLVTGLLYDHWIHAGKSEVMRVIGYTCPHPIEDYIVVEALPASPATNAISEISKGLDHVRGVLTEVKDAWKRAAHDTVTIDLDYS